VVLGDVVVVDAGRLGRDGEVQPLGEHHARVWPVAEVERVEDAEAHGQRCLLHLGGHRTAPYPEHARAGPRGGNPASRLVESGAGEGTSDGQRGPSGVRSTLKISGSPGVAGCGSCASSVHIAIPRA